MPLTYEHGPHAGRTGSFVHGIDAAVAKQVEAIHAGRPAAFMREARAFASTSRRGSVERLRDLITQYRLGRWYRNRHQRVLIVAEIIKIRATRN